LTGIGGEFEKADIQHPTGTQSARYFAQVQSNAGLEVQISESPLLCALFGGLARFARFEGRLIPWCAFVITAALIQLPGGFRYRLWPWFECHECSPFLI
jgi:hypothetical protein